MRKKRVFFIVAVAAALLAVVALDGYVLGPMNLGRAMRERRPVLCRCTPHDGGGAWYRGITYKLTTLSFGTEIEFESCMPFLKDRELRKVERGSVESGGGSNSSVSWESKAGPSKDKKEGEGTE